MATSATSIFRVRPDDWAEMAKQLGDETDRGAALVEAAFLDRLTAALIEGFFVEDNAATKALLKGPLAPLGTFSSRIAVAYSLGLISADEQHDLSIVRDIRNLFAHELGRLSFSKEAIKRKVRVLRIPRLMPNRLLDADTLEARQLFINGAAMLSTFFGYQKVEAIGQAKARTQILY